MGTLHYGNGHDIEIDDVLLAHLKLVVITKLRRNESFTLSWKYSEHPDRGRNTIWLHPAVPLRFVFEQADPAPLSPEWLEQMATSSHSTGGLVVDLDQAGPV